MSTSSIRPATSADRGPKAPPRLVDGGGTDYERQLISSASRDRVPATSMAQVAAGLREAVAAQGRGAAAAASLPGARAAGSLGVLRNVRPWAIGAVGVGVVAAMMASAGKWRATPAGAVAPLVDVPDEPRRTLDVETRQPNIGMPSMPAVVAAHPPVVGSSSRPSDPPRRVARRAAAKPAVAPALTDDTGPPAKAGLGLEAGLAAEVRAIESIQTLLGWGQVQQAADAVADYRRRFPKGELALEADLLDVDVAVARGDRMQAKQLARALRARPAAARYRARLEAIDDRQARPDHRAGGSIDGAGYMKERR
jgi:hypothetical protein